MDTLRGTVVAILGRREAELQVTQIGGSGTYKAREYIRIDALCDVERDLTTPAESVTVLEEALVNQRVRCFVLGRDPDAWLRVQLQVLSTSPEQAESRMHEDGRTRND